MFWRRLALLARRRWRAVFLLEECQDITLLLLLWSGFRAVRGSDINRHFVVSRWRGGEGGVRVSHVCGWVCWSWSWLELRDEGATTKNG
jgi:hypothetical protein